MTEYQVILFDLDGTLTDSKPGIINSVMYALDKVGFKVDDPDKLDCFIGPPLRESFQEFCGFEEQKALKTIQYYREYFADRGIYENSVYPEIPELLAHLKQNNRELLVATNKPTPFAKRIIEHFHLDRYFSAVIGSNFDGTLGSKTAVIEYALAKVPQVPKQNFIMVGDRKHDIIGAKNNNIASVGVTYGYGSTAELQEVKPEYIAGSVAELYKII